ncbi:MAG: RnfABCDGE type electron transport complex subunit D [Spirochaetes bacterium]|nr:RnfABCDGE type electron transport complex subunit D [Spirochaetota bacterium]
MDNQEKPDKLKLIVSSSPHLQNEESTRSIMWTVTIFLLPAAIFGMYAFGWYAVIVVLSCILTAMLTEAVCQLMCGRPITLADGSAVLTGLLLGMNMPPAIPLYIPILSTVFAIALVKHAFGGLGQNWANPAIAGRVFALFAWTKPMTTWVKPFVADTVTTATPLGAVKSMLMAGDGASGASGSSMELLQSASEEIIKTDTSQLFLFFGNKAGCIGEISVFLLLLGAVYLIYKKIITLDIPVAFIGSAALIAWIFDGLRFGQGYFSGDPLFHILTGGMVLGAFFMATDMVTTPLTVKGRLIFGVGCGVITMLIRMYGGLPEGVSLSILFMNMMTPAIDRFVQVKPLGYVKVKKAA